jgi:hypothetical protein
MIQPRLSVLVLLAGALLAAAGTAQDSPKKKLRDLRAEFHAAMEKWQQDQIRKIEAAKESGGPIPAFSMVPPSGPFIKRAQALAEEYTGTDDAIRFHFFVVEYATVERDAMRAALTRLREHHTASEDIGDYLYILPDRSTMLGTSEVVALLTAIVDGNKSEDAIVQALIARSSVRLRTAKDDAERRLARADLQRIKDVTEDEDYLAQADQMLFELDNLQVGCKAPEIEGADTDGVAFKLSDYRGKVILLDFWGFW